eukprot:gb/GFBE01007156.1/.p1 GENE.gb/GFBE01007156.1/~~gb/GFBE01007156.1/.p1  ORF type:complete len:183 (+),score=31.49 gb/GFBE01007156.1/:1-549(+)
MSGAAIAETVCLSFGTEVLKQDPEDVKRTLDQIIALETAGYPADEAASPENLDFRLTKVPHLFLVAFEGSDVVGFVCSTRMKGQEPSEESMSVDDPDGRTVCVHSVCVREDRRRRGLALHMLSAYVEQMRSLAKDQLCEASMLLCKSHLVEMYKRAGYQYIGPSAVVHGAEQWHDMKMVFDK